MFHVDAIHCLGLEAWAQRGTNLPPAWVEHLAPPVIMDTSQSMSTLTLEGQPLTQTVIVDATMPFHVLINNDVEDNLMSL
jgi:hypothetical protein